MSSQHFVGVYNLIDNPSHSTTVASASSSSTHLESKSNGNEAQAKRPPNAFILFRRYMWEKERSGGCKKEQQNELSKDYGKSWQEMDDVQRRPWLIQAKKLRDQHKIDYPNYQYHKGGKKRKITVQGDDKPARTTQPMPAVAPVQHVPSARRRRQRRRAPFEPSSSVHATASTSQVPQPSSSGLPPGPFKFGLPSLQPSRSRTTSATPGPATPFSSDHQTVDPIIAYMSSIAEPLNPSPFDAYRTQPHPGQQELDAQAVTAQSMHNAMQAHPHPAQQPCAQASVQYSSQQQVPRLFDGTYAVDEGVVDYENEVQDRMTKRAEANFPSLNTMFAQGQSHSSQFAPAGPYDGVLSSQSSSHAAFLESNGIPISNLPGDFALSGPLDDVAFSGLSDNAKLFGGSGFALSGMANEAPYNGAHTGFGYAPEFSVPTGSQRQPQAYSTQLQAHSTHSAQADISSLTQPTIPLEAPVAPRDTSITPRIASFTSPELAPIPLRRTRQHQLQREDAGETIPSIPSANGPSSRKPSPEEDPAPSLGYLRAPHEYTEQDHLHDNISSPNEPNVPSLAHSFPQATSSSHRRTVSSSSCWPAMRNMREHRRFCSDTPITQPSVQRTGDWLTDWKTSGLANAQPNLTWRPQLDAFANVPQEPLGASTPSTAQDALYANAQTASYAAQETGLYMDALPTSYADTQATSYTVPATSYNQPPTPSYTDAQTRSYVDSLTTSSSQGLAFPPAPGLSYTQPSTSYEQGSAQSYPDPAMQPYPSAQTQPYPSAQIQPYADTPIGPDTLLDPYSQASALPFPDAPIPPHPDLTTPYYEPVNSRYGSGLDRC